jgi:carbon-monoxide dehydrogenase large subunit
MSAWIGTSVKRVEDPALVIGRGRFVDDIHLPGTLHAAFVRSPYAHARIGRIDASRALELDGVHSVVTFADLPAPLREKRIPLLVPNPLLRHALTPYALPKDEVCHAGEGVAVVLAYDRYLAEDGAERVNVDYEPLPVAAEVTEALAPGAPTAHASLADNLAGVLIAGYGDIDAAFANAAHVVRGKFFQHRGSAHAMECRTLLARHDPATDSYTIWAGTQSPHQYRDAFALAMGIADEQVRVIAPDVGGGFGPKTVLYPDQFALPACARLAGRPVKWIEDRREHFLTTYQERDQHWAGELALDAGGRLLGLRARLLHDGGAYQTWGVVVPHICAATVPGPYVLPAYSIEVTVAMTNKVPVTPVRGAGRPQAVFFMERMMDRAAKTLGLDPAEIRRRNFIQPEQMPYEVGLVFRDGTRVTYDSGDYPRCQALALARAGYDGFAKRQAGARAEGRYIGIGTASYVEGTGLGPFEGASVRVQRNGKVVLKSGAAAQGQGHRTMLAQVCADALGVDFNDITVEIADTAKIAYGVGAFASRITANAAPAAHIAGRALREKVVKIAARLLEAAEADLEVASGRVFVKGVPAHGKTFAEIAAAAGGVPGIALPSWLDAGLEHTHYFSPERASYPNGCHVAEVEVDVETGIAKVLRYAVAHDCGTQINPMTVEGQVTGGVVHGIGNALFEWMRYDENAQPLTLNFGEYLLPLATDAPNVAQVHMVSPSPLNPLGVKGAGEGGTIPAIAAIVAAIENALAPFNVEIDRAPLTPEHLLGLIDAVRKGNE